MFSVWNFFSMKLIIFNNLMIYQPTTPSSSWWRFSFSRTFQSITRCTSSWRRWGRHLWCHSWCSPCQGPLLLQTLWWRSRKGVQPPLCEASVYMSVWGWMHACQGIGNSKRGKPSDDVKTSMHVKLLCTKNTVTVSHVPIPRSYSSALVHFWFSLL